MSKLSWKIALAGVAIAATTVYAVAQMAPGMHGQMMQGGQHGGMHGQSGRGDMAGHHAGVMPASPGQDAFGAIQEIVQILESDPTTDWSKVNIGVLREHLIDMNDVTLRAVASERMTDTGIEIAVTGEGRTRDAIKRMVPAHARELAAHGWNATTAERPDGVTLTVAASEKMSLVKLKALGFIGIMAQGGHHQPHHLMMAKGGFNH
jgi:hypothetical protein